jgi:hypothetical protein
MYSFSMRCSVCRTGDSWVVLVKDNDTEYGTWLLNAKGKGYGMSINALLVDRRQN